ncbi:MAG: alkaline phosphatase family protein [Methylococcaceae bacterium]|jgi:phospholipase C
MKKLLISRFTLKPVCLAFLVMATGLNFTVATAKDRDYKEFEESSEHETATPIKHVIVLIGENRSFDNVFATYVPRKGQRVANLLSGGIVNADGTPGAHAQLAAQAFLKNIPSRFFISQPAANKAPYVTLPPPNTSYAPAIGTTFAQIAQDPGAVIPPFDTSLSLAQLHQISPGLRLKDLQLLTTGGNNQSICDVSPSQQYPVYPPQGCNEDDQRVANFAALPNTMFPLIGKNLPYDSFTGDTVHRFYHMWQQSNCDISTATKANPSGCLNDLYPYVGVARNDGSGGNAMGFYNIQRGDAPVLKRLADEYSMSDNFHQAVMGGTFVQHMMLGTADAMPWQTYTNLAGVTISQPPASRITDPTPASPDSISFTADRAWTDCDAEWVDTINAYVDSLPGQTRKSPTTCESGKFYQINNARPGYLPNGLIDDAAITTGAKTPPSSVRTIGDALNEKKISWVYYGGGYDAAIRAANGSNDPIDLLIATGGDYYCDICNPFQYSKAIMESPAQRKAHLKDYNDFFKDLKRNRLPAVTYLKPDSFTDGHPASSKLNLFEALVERIHDALKDNPELFEETVLFVTLDEAGGYWDSGYFQPVDFFGDGPRIPLIAISPYTRGGHIDHTYGDHASIVKFIERNWGLSPLTQRSRDNLPNPKHIAANPYVPTNRPAIGDLFSLFKFAPRSR